MKKTTVQQCFHKLSKAANQQTICLMCNTAKDFVASTHMSFESDQRDKIRIDTSPFATAVGVFIFTSDIYSTFWHLHHVSILLSWILISVSIFQQLHLISLVQCLCPCPCPSLELSFVWITIAICFSRHINNHTNVSIYLSVHPCPLLSFLSISVSIGIAIFWFQRRWTQLLGTESMSLSLLLSLSLSLPLSLHSRWCLSCYLHLHLCWCHFFFRVIDFNSGRCLFFSLLLLTLTSTPFFAEWEKVQSRINNPRRKNNNAMTRNEWWRPPPHHMQRIEMATMTTSIKIHSIN